MLRSHRRQRPLTDNKEKPQPHSVDPALPVSVGGETKNRRSLLSGVYVRGSKRSHQSALQSVTVVDSTTLRWLSTCEFSCASSVSDSFCRVDTASTETVCEFIATVESRLADSFLSRGYGDDACLSDSLRVLAVTSKRFYSARNCRQFQHVEYHGTTHRYRSCVTRNREIVEREPRTFIHVIR